MRQSLVVSYLLSLLIFGTLLSMSILAGPSRNTIFYRGSLDPNNFTQAFSKNVNGSYLLNLFGSPKIVMILLNGSGLLLHSIFLYRITSSKKTFKKTAYPYLVYWGVLLLPYVLLLIITI